MEQSEGREFTKGHSEVGQDAPPLASCFWCGRPHPGEHPLSVCPACTARYSTMQSLEMSRVYIGRSDCDVRQRLHEWVGMPSRYESDASGGRHGLDNEAEPISVAHSRTVLSANETAALVP